MTASQLRDFTDLLNNRLVAAAITPDIAWPNAVYTPVKGQPYLKVEIAGRARSSLGFGQDGVQQWQGTYQVGIYVPRDSGTRDQDILASQVLNLFPRGLTLLTSQGFPLIVTLSTAPPAEEFGDWSNLPVSVSWFSLEMAAPPAGPGALLLEDGSGRWLLEDGSGGWSFS